MMKNRSSEALTPEERLRVLMLEDSSSDAEINEIELEKGGIPHSARRVDTKEDFLRELQEFSPHIILSDLSLPGFGGLPALKLLQEIALDIPFIFVTGTIGEDSAIEMLKLGATDYVLKGRISRLVPAVRRALQEVEEKRSRRQTEKRYKSLVDNMRELLFTLDPAGNFTFANPAAEEVTGYGLEKLLSMNIFEVIAPEYHGVIRPDEIGAVRSNEPEDPRKTAPREIEIISSSGGRRWVQVSCSIIYDEGNNATGMQGIAREITKEKDLQRQLAQAQKMEAIGRLAGGVAHDFNNILTVISGFGALAKETLPPSHPGLEDIDEVMGAAGRAAKLIRQLLVFSRRQAMEPQKMLLSTLITDLQKMLGRLIGERIELDTRIESNLWPVKADPGMIEQVIVNLAVNAHDAMPDGGRLIIEAVNEVIDEDFAYTHPDLQPGEYVLLTVNDTGCGMTGEVKSHLFEPFYTTKEEGKGTGLGLSTVYGIVRQHQGSIYVYSEPGQGATFDIYLPRLIDNIEEAPPQEPARESLPRGVETVLVVEDSNPVREVTVKLLGSLGYNVMSASCGEEALILCEKHHKTIHLLLSDVVLPHLGGFGLYKLIMEKRPDIRVLFVSGYMEDNELLQNITEGKVPFLKKPFTTESLSQAVRDVLDGRV